MTDKQTLIDKYALVPTPYHATAWRHFLSQAQSEKEWALTVPHSWFNTASEASLKWRNECARTNVLILAAREYAYSYYRASSRQGTYLIDPIANELWHGFGEVTP